MGIFNFFKKKKTTVDNNSEATVSTERLLAEFERKDFLGKAAVSGHKAKTAVKNKQYDKAWELFHKQKTLYMQHADRCGFTANHTLALDATVHEELANILRLESKHEEAFTNIVYWVLAGSDRPIKRHQQKLKSYFNRCKFKNTSLTEVEDTIASNSALPDYTLARSFVSEWVIRG